MSVGPRRAVLLALLTATIGCAEEQGHPAGEASPPGEERVALGAAFVGGSAGGLDALLHSDLVVQPPAPDSAVRGAAAVAYLTGLAAHTQVAESRLDPQAFVAEGPFLLEQGTWMLRSGDQVLGSRYHLRWRHGGNGWKVVLLRWSPFR